MDHFFVQYYIIKMGIILSSCTINLVIKKSFYKVLFMPEVFIRLISILIYGTCKYPDNQKSNLRWNFLIISCFVVYLSYGCLQDFSCFCSISLEMNILYIAMFSLWLWYLVCFIIYLICSLLFLTELGCKFCTPLHLPYISKYVQLTLVI